MGLNAPLDACVRSIAVRLTRFLMRYLRSESRLLWTISPSLGHPPPAISIHIHLPPCPSLVTFRSLTNTLDKSVIQVVHVLTVVVVVVVVLDAVVVLIVHSGGCVRSIAVRMSLLNDSARTRYFKSELRLLSRLSRRLKVPWRRVASLSLGHGASHVVPHHRHHSNPFTSWHIHPSLYMHLISIPYPPTTARHIHSRPYTTTHIHPRPCRYTSICHICIHIF